MNVFKKLIKSSRADEKAKCRQNVSEPIFFIHIPKTAGTSFRIAAEAYWGDGSVEKDYDTSEKDTTALVKEWVNEKADYYTFYHQMRLTGARMVTGHVRAFPAVAIFPLLQTATFLRNPVDQAISHYNHCVRWHGYDDSFEEFVKKRGNQQVYALNGVPVHLMGFVGITEAYEKSLALFNHLYDADVRPININKNDQKRIETPDIHRRELIENVYSEDVRLYDCMSKLLQQRLDAVDKGLPWCHGAILGNEATLISGYACWANTDAPVIVTLFDGDNKIAETEAVHYVPFVSRFVTPRGGHIGFQFDIRAIRDKSNLKVIVTSTGQVLEDELMF